jgi:hypothetical protein
MDKTTLLNKGFHIPNPNRFMWSKQNKTMINMLKGWKIDLNEDEEWASKARLVTLFLMK